MLQAFTPRGYVTTQAGRKAVVSVGLLEEKQESLKMQFDFVSNSLRANTGDGKFLIVCDAVANAVRKAEVAHIYLS